MLDVAYIRKNPDLVKAGVKKKNIDSARVDAFLKTDGEWRKRTAELDELRSKQNLITEQLKNEKNEARIVEARELKNKAAELEEKTAVLAAERRAILNALPNIPDETVPLGRDEGENRVLREVGKKRAFSFKPKDYLSIGETLGIIDVKKSADVSGARFGYLKGDGALLEFALVNLAVKTLAEKGFTPVIPPVMIKPDVYENIGRLAEGQKDERFYLAADDKYLVGTAEHTLIPLEMNETREEKDLPIRYAGFSSCFRREAGSYGKDTRGILRVHQFDKVEMVSFTAEEESEKETIFLLSLQEALWQKLEIPYRVVEICTGDMGWTDARQFDIETWLPGQPASGGEIGTYRETNSCSNTKDFQTRGINAKYRKKNGETVLMHCLNATAFAVGRVIITLLENYQEPDGSVKIPKALQSFMGKKIIARPKTDK